MVDSLTKGKRSWNMSRIKSKNTKPELIVRSMLHKLGYRFRLHRKDLPGKPDIVLPKYKTVIFVHGCYWHRHPGCKYAYNPKSKKKFWQNKFRQNIMRDIKNQTQLKKLGWNVIIVWECEIRNINRLCGHLKKKFVPLQGS
jgi:DNA mismatch endonuclease (patch repair protein)